MEVFSQTKLRSTLAASLLVAGSAAWAQPVVPAGLDAELEPRRALERQMQQQQRLQEEQAQRQRRPRRLGRPNKRKRLPAMAMRLCQKTKRRALRSGKSG